ncbi:MAG: GNAT family N-acetyltransferase [Acidimicrobiia bacterium]|nr:GNAT family N-acetyltransferase [Acidimicrobiia bacterium]
MTMRTGITSRPLSGWSDVMRIHEFLAEIYAETRTGRAWEIRRWEGSFWHDDPDTVAQSLATSRADIRIWEEGGAIVAVAHPEGQGDVHLETHPRRADIEDEMLAWAEDALSRSDGGSRTLTAFALTDDRRRRALLATRGYRREPWHLVQRWRSLVDDAPSASVADGYRLRSLRPGDVEDASALAQVINAAFGHSFGPSALLNFERSPSYRHELQIVAQARDGTIAAHAGVTLDRRNLLAIVEPVCTHPDHRRRGLASACMAEGIRRARALGAMRATVSTGDDNPSNEVYARLGFAEVEVVEAWRKTWSAD